MADEQNVQLYHMSVSPHIRAKYNTGTIMRDVLIALSPAAVFGIVWMGIRALLVIAVCMATCALCEWLWEKLNHQKSTLWDCSALVTGMLLAMNLPPSIPIWMAVIGSAFAIIIVKQVFGGIGQNFMNPALAARCFMLIAWVSSMTSFSVQGVASATPLTQIATGADQTYSILNCFLGTVPGCIGETSALCLLAGGVYLLVRKVIDWTIPFTYIAVVCVLTFCFGRNGFYEIFAGGLMLGAFFMATDYSTSPMTKKGRIIFGIGCGILTVIIRRFSSGYPEGVSFSILIMNICVPFIDRFCVPKIYGEVKKK